MSAPIGMSIGTLGSVLAVAVGSALGALARWQAGVWFNPVWSGFPLGTLFVNALGGLLIGLRSIGQRLGQFIEVPSPGSLP